MRCASRWSSHSPTPRIERDPQRRTAARLVDPGLRLRRDGLRSMVAAAPRFPACLGHRSPLVRDQRRMRVRGKLVRLERTALPRLVPDRRLLRRRVPRRGHDLPAFENAVRLLRRRDGFDRGPAVVGVQPRERARHRRSPLSGCGDRRGCGFLHRFVGRRRDRRRDRRAPPARGTHRDGRSDRRFGGGRVHGDDGGSWRSRLGRIRTFRSAQHSQATSAC